MLRRNGYYEDLEDQGRLAKLPCKVGEKLYYIDSYYDTVVPVRLDEVITHLVKQSSSQNPKPKQN